MQKGARSRAQELLRGIDGSHVMLKQLLRNEQDTRMFDTYIVSSQLNAVVAAKAQTQAYNDAVQQRGRGHGSWTTVHLGVGGSGPRTHHGRNDAGEECRSRITRRVEQAVDRGEVRGSSAGSLSQ